MSDRMSYSNAPWPVYAQDEIDAVETVLRSGKVNYWTGTIGRDFEKAYADYVGVRHAIAVANGTVALDLAWIALGIGRGDEVIVTSRTFLASVSSIVLAGATPVFADVDRITGWAQINGRNAISWEQKFALDTWYVEHESIWLDLKILALTVWRVLRRDGISAAGEATMPRFEGNASAKERL